MTCHFWRLSEAGADNLGLACTNDGLLLGRTLLIERRDGRFVIRAKDEIERLLRRAYGTGFSAARIMPGLGTVASALNANDLCLACIAAVHLRLPDLPSQTARDDVAAEDSLLKYARDEGESAGAEWDPAEHPRTGTPPNPGWFAPTDGVGDKSSPVWTAQNDDPTRRSDARPSGGKGWVRLPPGPKRIDELADFVEWMANATPQDEEAIRAEIKRYFYDVGDHASAAALNSTLTVLLRPGLTTEDRQRILDSLDVYTRADPAEYARNRDWATGAAIAAGGVVPGAAGESGAVEPASSEVAAEGGAVNEGAAAEAAAPSEVWKYGWAKRGKEIHDLLSDGSLDANFPSIDMISPSGVVTSIKSINLNAAVYQNETILMYRVSDYVGKVSDFGGAQFAGVTVGPDQISARVLQLVIPKGSMSDEQKATIDAVRAWAKTLEPPVDVVVTEL